MSITIGAFPFKFVARSIAARGLGSGTPSFRALIIASPKLLTAAKGLFVVIVEASVPLWTTNVEYTSPMVLFSLSLLNLSN